MGFGLAVRVSWIQALSSWLILVSFFLFSLCCDQVWDLIQLGIMSDLCVLEWAPKWSWYWKHLALIVMVDVKFRIVIRQNKPCGGYTWLILIVIFLFFHKTNKPCVLPCKDWWNYCPFYELVLAILGWFWSFFPPLIFLIHSPFFLYFFHFLFCCCFHCFFSLFCFFVVRLSANLSHPPPPPPLYLWSLLVFDDFKYSFVLLLFCHIQLFLCRYEASII